MKNKARKGILHDFNNYYKAAIIKIIRYWHKDRQREGQNRIEDPK